MKQPSQLPTEPITVHTTSNATEFLARMQPLLLKEEARYGLMLGIAITVERQPEYYSQHPPYFAIAEDAEGVAAAAVMTPPHGLIVYSEQTDSAPGLTAIANTLANAGWSLPSANGPEPVCTYFASIWAEIAGVNAEVGIRERVFELREVIPPIYSLGQLRQATFADVDLLSQWYMEFKAEAFPVGDNSDTTEARGRIEDKVEQGALYIWQDQDGEAVSFSGTSRPTPTGIAIGPVYTPPQFRGKGYASSCVAQLSQLLLDQGRQFCTLFTDLANPTSNHIYQSIGYRAVCDYTVYFFKDSRRAKQEKMPEK